MADEAAPVYRLIGAKVPLVATGGQSVIAMPNTTNIYGGFIINPSTGIGQGLLYPETLYVSIAGPALTYEGVATTAVYPGSTFTVPGGVSVWVNAESDGHRFTAMFAYPETVQVAKPVTVAGDWPPLGPTGLNHVIYAYAYQQYSDDEDVQALFRAINEMQQDYVDTFNGLQLPVWSNPVISGKLADWVLEGIYGYPRPTLYSQRHHPIGPLNTYWPNGRPPLNMLMRQTPVDVHVASDDLYKRCATWHLQKGDGRYFNVRWLKRRVMRFLIGTNGTSPHIDNTDRISVEFGDGMACTIRIITKQRHVTGGAMPNRFGPNGVIDNRTKGPDPVPPNTIFSAFETFPPLQYASQLKEAVEAGILELPFQFRWDVVIG